MAEQYLIKKIRAWWILDSRGVPTIELEMETENGIKGSAAVPSGASTGEHEVLELRDGGKSFLGRGVQKAIDNINEKIANVLKGIDVRDQKTIDDTMIKLDGTKNKSNLGGNAILAVSLAAADTAAKCLKMELFEYIFDLYRDTNNAVKQYVLPVPLSNVLNGGSHAGNNLAIQEFMIVPINAKRYSEAIMMISEVYHHLKNLLKTKFGKSAINLGDEGGFAPNLNYTRDALDLILHAIDDSGYNPKKDIFIALDSAASEFFENNKYKIDDKSLSSDELLDYYVSLINEYPIITIEDPFNENDFGSFSKLTNKIGSKIQIVGDDIFVTQLDRIKRGIDEKSANALLLKVNQVGTLYESLKAAELCQQNNFNVIVSHRSGETENTFISDLTVGLSFKKAQIKTGAPARSERTAKYNRLLKIENLLLNKGIYAGTNF